MGWKLWFVELFAREDTDIWLFILLLKSCATKIKIECLLLRRKYCTGIYVMVFGEGDTCFAWSSFDLILYDLECSEFGLSRLSKICDFSLSSATVRSDEITTR